MPIYQETRVYIFSDMPTSYYHIMIRNLHIDRKAIFFTLKDQNSTFISDIGIYFSDPFLIVGKEIFGKKKKFNAQKRLTN